MIGAIYFIAVGGLLLVFAICGAIVRVLAAAHCCEHNEREGA